VVLLRNRRFTIAGNALDCLSFVGRVEWKRRTHSDEAAAPDGALVRCAAPRARSVTVYVKRLVGPARPWGWCGRAWDLPAKQGPGVAKRRSPAATLCMAPILHSSTSLGTPHTADKNDTVLWMGRLVRQWIPTCSLCAASQCMNSVEGLLSLAPWRLSERRILVNTFERPFSENLFVKQLVDPLGRTAIIKVIVTALLPHHQSRLRPAPPLVGPPTALVPTAVRQRFPSRHELSVSTVTCHCQRFSSWQEGYHRLERPPPAEYVVSAVLGVRVVLSLLCSNSFTLCLGRARR